MPPLQPKSNTSKPHIPEGLEVGAKVEILGEQGLYLVVRVDEQRYAADLMLMGKTARVEQGVSFNNIRPVAERRGTGSARGFLGLNSEKAGKTTGE